MSHFEDLHVWRTIFYDNLIFIPNPLTREQE